MSMIPAMLIPVTPLSGPEVIVKQLSDAIARGELKPGQKLPSEAILAKHLGVATMTLRQALSVLRDCGLVETRRGRTGGTFILKEPDGALARRTLSPITRHDLRELTDWRNAVSGEAVALAAERATAEQIREIQLAMVECDSLKGSASYRRADAALHMLIAAASGSTRLSHAEAAIQQELESLLTETALVNSLRPSIYPSHEAIVKEIVDRNKERARLAMQAHAESTHNWFSGLKRFPEGRTAD